MTVPVCLSILLLMRTWAVSSFWLLWIKLMWTFLYWALCRHVFISLPWEWNCWYMYVLLCNSPESFYSFTLPRTMSEPSGRSVSYCQSFLFYFILIFYFSHFSGCVIFLWFYFVFSWQQMMLSTCSYICWPFVHLMVKCLFKSYYPFLLGLFVIRL